MKGRYSCQSKRRVYKRADAVVIDVLRSRKFNKKGRLISMKAMCSDGVIRKVNLAGRNQAHSYYEGVVQICVKDSVLDVRGTVDVSSLCDKYTNVGAMFIHNKDGVNGHLLPDWNIPGWQMPYDNW
jgi:hypothetical protein